MLGNILREFLIRIGYDIDAASERKFTSSVAGVTELVAELGVVVEATAGAMLIGLGKMSEGMEQFYFMSQRTLASVQGIKAMSFAAKQFGISAEDMQSSMEGLGAFMRNNPLAKSFIEGKLHVALNDAKGNPRDTADVMQDIGHQFQKMPFYIANAYGAVLGFSQGTVRALRAGLADSVADYNKIAKQLGVDQQAAAVAGHGFMMEVRRGEETLDILGDRVLQLLGPKATQMIAHWRESLTKHFDQVSKIITYFSTLVLNAADVFDRLVLRGIEGIEQLYKGFMGLPLPIREVIGVLGALALALQVFSLETLAITGIGAAILLVYDDYKTWKEGGKHFIDWDAWEPEIKKFHGYLIVLRADFENFNWTRWKNSSLELGAAFWSFGAAVWDLTKAIFSGLIPGIDAVAKKGGHIDFLDATITTATNLLHILTDIAHVLKAIWDADPNELYAAGVSAQKDIGAFVKQSAPGQWAAPLVKSAYASWQRYTAGQQGIYDQTNHGTLGDQNNNPGNLRSWMGVPTAGGFAKFNSVHSGLEAMKMQLQLYAARGHNTIRSIIDTWAPPGDHNNTGQYEKTVSKDTGYGLDTKLDLSDPNTMAHLMNAMIMVEQGHRISPEALARVTRDGVGITPINGKEVAINQTNTYHISGGDPHAIAGAVAGKQTTANAQLLRNVKGTAS
jgi:hypothetical protein